MTVGKLLHSSLERWGLVQIRDEFTYELATIAYEYLVTK
jgi:hypothetical protein